MADTVFPLNEHDVSFFTSGGHTHDGVDSTTVAIPAGTIDVYQLKPTAIDYLRNNGGGGGGGGVSSGGSLTISVPGPIAAGADVTGMIAGAANAVIARTQVSFTGSSTIDLSFYHSGDFAPSDYEYHSVGIQTGFSDGVVWSHSDTDNTNNFYYRVHNSGGATVSAIEITLSLATAIAPSDINTVNGLSLVGDVLIPATGEVFLGAGVGVGIVRAGNTFTFSTAPINNPQGTPPTVPGVTGLTGVAGIDAKTGNPYITVSWTYPVQAGVEFNVILNQDGFGVVQTFNTPNTNCQFANLLPSQLYHISVQVQTTAGQYSTQATVDVTTGIDTVPPAVPANVVISAGLRTVSVSWDAVTTIPVAASYTVQIDTVNTFNSANLQTLVVTLNSAIFNVVSSATTYYAQVKATSASKISSAYSTPVSAQTALLTATDVPAGSVVSTLIGQTSISGSDIANQAITAANIANAAITGAQIASQTIAAANIVNASLTGAQIASQTIAAANIVNASLTGAQIAAQTIGASNIVANSITTNQIAANTITATNIAANTIDAGNIVANTITTNQIAANTITGTNIAAQTIDAGNIVSNSITTNQIAANTILGNNISANTIDAGKIVANTITAAQIAANTITAAQILANTITAGQIAAGTITANQIASNTITTSQLSIVGANLVDNGNFDFLTFGAANGWSGPGGIASGGANGAPNSYRIYAASSTETVYNDAFVQVSPGDQIYISTYLKVDSGTNGTSYVQVLGYATRTGAQTTTSNAISVSNAGISTTGFNFYDTKASKNLSGATGYDSSFVVPSGVYYVRVAIVQGSDCTTGSTYFSTVVARRAANAVEIGNGAVTANQIAANSINATHIAAGTIAANSAIIGSAAIGSAQISSVTANQITSGQISTALLSITGGGVLRTSQLNGSYYSTVIFDTYGLHLYNNQSTQYGTSGAPVIDINVNGSANFSGTITSSTINSTTLNTVNLYSATVYSGSLNINGNFIVTTTGIMTARQAILDAAGASISFQNNGALLGSISSNSGFFLQSTSGNDLWIYAGGTNTIHLGNYCTINSNGTFYTSQGFTANTVTSTGDFFASNGNFVSSLSTLNLYVNGGGFDVMNLGIYAGAYANVAINNLPTLSSVSVGFTGNSPTGGILCLLSSLRKYKLDIRDIDENPIYKLRPRLFDYVDSYFHNEIKPETFKYEAGFIVEELLEVDDQLITRSSADGDPIYYKHSSLIAYLTDAVQKLNARVIELEHGPTP